MQPRKRMKMCFSCDGMVDLDVIVCPYCGSDMAKDVKEASLIGKEKPKEEKFSALYPPPPYKPQGTAEEEVFSEEDLQKEDDLEKQTTSYNINQGYEDTPSWKEPLTKDTSGLDRVETKAANLKEEVKAVDQHNKKMIVSTLVFSLGINLLLFALFLFVFSTNGEIFLRWNTHFWYLYGLLGAVLVFLGQKLLNQLKA